MAELHVLNIEPGSEAPTLATSGAQVGMPVIPNCPDCGANHWMHSSPDMHTTELRCLDCGEDHTLVGPGQVSDT